MKSIRLLRLRGWKKTPSRGGRRRAARRWSIEPLEARRLLAIDLPAVLDVDGNRNGVLDVAEIEALSQSLDSGTYIFARQSDGRHEVRVAPDPVGALAPHETLMTLNFRGAVSGVKWNDQNGNGLRDVGEPGMGGVRIYADLNSDGAFNAGEPFTITAADGGYRLILDPGFYSLREEAPPGTVQTFPLGAPAPGAAQPLLFAGETLSAGPSSSGSAWHNADRPADVNADGEVTVLDAVGVVGALRDGGTRALGEGESGSTSTFFSQTIYVDVTGDAVLSVGDLVAVVEVLRAEGEASAQNDRPGQRTPDPFTLTANTTDNVLPVLDNDAGTGRLTIVGVGTLEGGIVGTMATGDHGGQIEVQSGGAQSDDVVLYTPQPDFYGIERFIYQVRDEADNTTDTAEVIVNVVPDRDYARFTLQAFEVDGVTPAPSVEIGEEFILRVSVKDERANFTPTALRGVFSAYLDLAYDEGLLDLVAVPPDENPHGFSRDVRFSSQYQELISIDAFLPGLIDEAGATQTDGFEIDTQPLGPEAQPFFDARFRATAVGTANFSANPADAPEHQFVFFRPSNLEPLNQQFVAYDPLSLTITPPIGAVADAFTRNEDLEGPAGSPLVDPVLDLLANDVPFTPGQPLRIVGLGPNDANSIATSAGGQVEIINNGQAVRYTPPADFHGADSFVYRAAGGQQSETAAVSITLLPVNDAPAANDDSFVADNESTLAVAAPGVLGNDTDVDGDTLTVADFQAVSDLGAQVSVEGDGGFTYNPLTSAELVNLGPGEVRIDSFQYTISDGAGGQATATVQVLVSRNTGGAHIIEISAGGETTNVNFGNRILGEGEWDDAIEAIALDILSHNN